ncbi:zinc finger CCHC domain-containing protein 14 isoform X2 [Denticeps clupeoides]|uniref:CCHC-type domain-containing protein n=1 Tax=Denticeps clupeoides TaxID=299321 RepID=A0AAY4DIT0_9TELE|nr:zinc finger CCHC domain-containing protein 14 isoform X2 [Denticeps clupeoides]
MPRLSGMTAFRMVEGRCALQREGVFRWFSMLSSARRAEFLCGLLDLCVPVELRFLGSCLEDLARKDYYSLRDAEIKANNPADLAGLTNITDEVVRSKLLVSLALLSSDNREAAAVLFRTLTHTDSIIHNYGLQLHDGQTGEQFLLLFTMASNHPAFSFHQKQVLRQELAQMLDLLQVTCGRPTGTVPAPNSGGDQVLQRDACEVEASEVCDGHEYHQLQTAAPPVSSQELPVKEHMQSPSKVFVEKVEVRGVLQKTDKSPEYLLEVLWSDSSVLTVSRTPQDVMNLLTQICQIFPGECVEKSLPLSKCKDTTHELELRCLIALPAHVLKHDKVSQFFITAPSVQLPASTSYLLQYRGTNRPICGVASIQSVMGVHPPSQLPPPPASIQAMQFPPSGAVGESSILSPPQTHLMPVPNATSNPSLLPQPHAQQLSQEQNCLLDWLRKLRLHKYYPIFKQLTMEEFLALTEEDLNKYDLTQGAKKKLKTQLELQKIPDGQCILTLWHIYPIREKLEKRFGVSQYPVPCGAVARVTPTSHTHSSSSAELHVEVDAGALPVPRDSGSSSGYSSAPSSPMTPAFNRQKDPHAYQADLDPGDKERSCVMMNPTVPSGYSRPTAQVMPVQNEPNLSQSHLILPPPHSLPLLSPGHILSSPRKPCPLPLCPEDRVKSLASWGRLENMFPGLCIDGSPPAGFHQENLGPMASVRSSSGLMVETSTALTATSKTLHHISHPPLHLQLSSSLQPRAAGCYPCHTAPSSSAPSSSLASRPTFPAPITAAPSNIYNFSSISSVASNSSPASTETTGYEATVHGSSSSSSSSSVCVCSSCGCSGNCGLYGTLPTSYAGYFPLPFSAASVFTLGPLLHLSPLLAGGAGVPSQFSYPLVVPPLYSSKNPESSMPPMQGILGGGQCAYQSPGRVDPGISGQLKKGGGNASCYNCGGSGHRAPECGQPSMDSSQQGIFRLKFAPQTDSQDSGD